MDELHVTAGHVGSAQAPEDLFGALTGDGDEKTRAVNHTYKTLVQVVHPDKYIASPKDFEVASAAFRQLTEMRRRADAKILAGTYGDRKVDAPKPPDPVDATPMVITVGKRKFFLKGKIAEGDLCDIYRCTFDDKGHEVDAVFKVVQSGADNDLVEHEAKILNALYPAKQADEKFYRYLPRLLDTFQVRNAPGDMFRRANVFPRLKEYRSLAEVLAAFPGGLDYRDVVWVFKRMLEGMGFYHRQGFVHGAVVPPHVMVAPIGHGAKFIDWSYAVNTKDAEPPKPAGWAHLKKPGPGPGRVSAIVSAYLDYYASEILNKEPVNAQTDIYMAAKCVVALLGGDVKTDKVPTTVPAQFRGFISTCLTKTQARRPDDAWGLHDELDALLFKLVGKPVYRPLNMP
jgi:serine/threonine protein kinase